MPNQLRFKDANAILKSSTILAQEQVKPKVTFQQVSRDNVNNDVPTSWHSSQQEAPLHFKNKNACSKLKDLSKTLGEEEVRKESGDGSFETKPSHSESGLNIRNLTSSETRKLQFKESGQKKNSDSSKQTVRGDMAHNVEENHRQKPNIE